MHSNNNNKIKIKVNYQVKTKMIANRMKLIGETKKLYKWISKINKFNRETKTKIKKQIQIKIKMKNNCKIIN